MKSSESESDYDEGFGCRSAIFKSSEELRFEEQLEELAEELDDWHFWLELESLILELSDEVRESA
jgi:hypothetical protein